MAQVFSHAPLLPLHGHASPPCCQDEPSDMQQCPPFSFPARPAASDSSTPAVGSQPLHGTAHRRAHTSVNRPPPLPAFSFNPSSDDSPAPSTSTLPVPIPSNVPTHTVGRSRHRRVVSEFDGAQVGLHTPPDLSRSAPLPLVPSDPASSPRVHRHRRSGAVSSQDLSTLMTNDSPPVSPPQSNAGFTEGYKFGGGEAVQTPAPAGIPGAARAHSVPTDNFSRSVGFSDFVEVIPRPISLVSSESESSQSTVKENAASHGLDSALDSYSPPSKPSPTSHPSYVPMTASEEPQYTTLSGFDVTDMDLSNNFDGDDPTATVLSKPEEFVQWSDDDISPSTLPASYHCQPTTVSSQVADNSAAVIDLDFASVDVPFQKGRPNSASGYEKKRVSMYGGQTNAFMTGMQRHRRAESAPSLAPPSFPTTFREGSAAERGFGMENVFEEDEEEDEETSKPPTRILTHSSLPTTPAVETDDSHATSSHFSGHRQIHPTSTLLPAIQFAHAKPKDRLDSLEADVDLPLPKPPFVASEYPPTSASSSPKCCQSGMSSCEPSPRFRQSVDDVPSLISGSSTVGSFVHPSFPSTGSGSFRMGFAGSTYSLASSSKKSHKKRGSIISLSRLIGVHGRNGTKSELDFASSIARPPTSGSLRLPPTSRGRRLSRILKFWKHSKDEGAIAEV